MQLNKTQLKVMLDYHYSQYDRTSIAPDPLQFPHRYTNPADIELVAFLSSVFAYGTVTQIAKTIEKVLLPLGDEPCKTLTLMPENSFEKAFEGIIHRFYSGADVVILLKVVAKILKKYGRLEAIFTQLKKNHSKITPELIIGFFAEYFYNAAEKHGGNSHGLKFMFPRPELGSACKRFNLFLRWMVRKDELDFGIWQIISPSELIIPVDTHIAAIAKKLRLTNRKIADWKMAVEITENLRQFDALDPVKYDFSLCHIGIRGIKF